MNAIAHDIQSIDGSNARTHRDHRVLSIRSTRSDLRLWRVAFRSDGIDWTHELTQGLHYSSRHPSRSIVTTLLTGIFSSENHQLASITVHDGKRHLNWHSKRRILPAHEVNEIIEPRQTSMPSIELAQRFFAQFSRFSDQHGEAMRVQSLENCICTISRRERVDACSHTHTHLH